ncbi:Coatomer epsilon subunit [Gracilaria domingensis]|nr:Coatomer epsilon subunit [Gracilaria domingensis]
MSDELFELRNYFYLGNLASASQEGETVSVDDQKSQIERDVILKRIELAKGNYDAIIASVSDDSAPALQLVKVLAQLSKDPSSAETAAAKVEQFSTDEIAAASPSCLLMCAIVLAQLGDFDNALRCANRVRSLEEIAVMVQVLLRMDRPDAAEKEVAEMQSIDEDATLTQLANAWVHLYKGGEGVQEAIYMYQDLLERHGATDQILNGMAVCHLAMGKPDESERVLTEALTKNPNCVTSLINVICSSKYRNKPTELVNRYFAQLEKVAPSNAWLLDYRAKEAEFDALAEQLAAA